VKGTRNRPAREAPVEQEILSYWFPPGIHEADAGTYREQWLRWFAGGPEVEQDIIGRSRRDAGASAPGRTRLLGGDTARAARAHHRPRPVLLQYLQGHAAGLCSGLRRPAASSRRHRGRDGPRHGSRRSPILHAAPRPRRRPRPPGALGTGRSPRRGGPEPGAGPPQADVRVLARTGQGSPRRDGALRMPPAPDRKE
jgi:hypothetical protein